MFFQLGPKGCIYRAVPFPDLRDYNINAARRKFMNILSAGGQKQGRFLERYNYEPIVKDFNL